MSGIAAVYDPTSLAPAGAELDSLIGAIHHRGSSESAWFGAGVALAERLMPTTPEALHQSLPVRVMRGRYQVALDGRLDNRAELLAALRLDADAFLTDSDLIAFAYEKWGSNCVAKLVGDFAFLLWDSTESALLAARDQRGFRPLVYAQIGVKMLFGSEPQQLLSHCEVPERVDESFLACHLTGAVPPLGRTPYRSVREVPAAHYLFVQHGRMELQRYWSFAPGELLKYRRREEYAEHFEAVFDEALVAASRSVTSPKVLFSGGLDSSYILARMHTQDPRVSGIHAFQPDNALLDERRFAHLVSRELGAEVEEVDASDCWALSSTYQPDSTLDQPNLIMQAPLMVKMGQAVGRTGTTVLIDGIGGDEMMSGSAFYPAELIRAGHLVDAVHESHLWAQHEEISWWNVFLKTAIAPLSPMPLRRSYRSLRGRAPGLLPSWLDESAVRSAGFSSALDVGRQIGSGTRQGESQETWSGHVRDALPALGWRDRWATSPYGFESRSPFWDLRVLSLCLRIPAFVMRSAGQPKALLRQVMQSCVPSQVVQRRDKGSFDDLLKQGLFIEERSRVELALSGPLAELSYLKPELLRQEFELYRRTAHTWWSPLWRAITAGLWLRSEKPRRKRRSYGSTLAASI